MGIKDKNVNDRHEIVINVTRLHDNVKKSIVLGGIITQSRLFHVPKPEKMASESRLLARCTLRGNLSSTIKITVPERDQMAEGR